MKVSAFINNLVRYWLISGVGVCPPQLLKFVPIPLSHVFIFHKSTCVINLTLLTVGSSSDFMSLCVALRYCIPFFHYLRVFRPVREDKQYAANDPNQANRSHDRNSDASKHRVLTDIQNCIPHIFLHANERLLLAVSGLRVKGPHIGGNLGSSKSHFPCRPFNSIYAETMRLCRVNGMRQLDSVIFSF